MILHMHHERAVVADEHDQQPLLPAKVESDTVSPLTVSVRLKWLAGVPSSAMVEACGPCVLLLVRIV